MSKFGRTAIVQQCDPLARIIFSRPNITP